MSPHGPHRFAPYFVVLVVLVFLVVSLATPMWLSAETFYIDDGKGALTLSTNGDPTKLEVDEWQIRLYRSGTSAEGPDYWGLITGKTLESVQKDLKNSQEFERTYAKWSGQTEQDVDTNFNPSAPIAKLKRPVKKTNEVLARFLKLGPVVSDLWSGYGKIKRILATDSKGPNPFANVGKTLKEYLDNFKKVQHNLATIRHAAENTDKLSKDLLADLNKITADANSASKSYAQLPVDKIPQDWTSSYYTYDLQPGTGKLEQTVSIEGRNFRIQILYYQNGKVYKKEAYEGSLDSLDANFKAKEDELFGYPTKSTPWCVFIHTKPGKPIKATNRTFDKYDKGDETEASGEVRFRYSDQSTAVSAEENVKALLLSAGGTGAPNAAQPAK